MSDAYTQADWFLVIGLRRARIEVTHDGKLEIKHEESAEYAAKRLREYIDKEKDAR